MNVLPPAAPASELDTLFSPGVLTPGHSFSSIFKVRAGAGRAKRARSKARTPRASCICPNLLAAARGARRARRPGAGGGQLCTHALAALLVVMLPQACTHHSILTITQNQTALIAPPPAGRRVTAA